MKTVWSEEDKALMREAQASTMGDEGYAWRYSTTTQDEYGQVEYPYVRDEEPMEVGIEFSTGTELHGADMTVVQYDAVLRLPYGAKLGEKDRFELTGFRGEVLEVPILFEVQSPQGLGLSGSVVNLRKVET